MPDPTITAIDRFFDLVDNGVEKLDHVFNRGKRTEELHRARRAQRTEVLDAKEVPKAGKRRTAGAASPPASAVTLIRKPQFYIVEAITPKGMLFVVTDGGSARTECSTREFAEKILKTLEASS